MSIFKVLWSVHVCFPDEAQPLHSLSPHDVVFQRNANPHPKITERELKSPPPCHEDIKGGFPS